MSQYIYGGSSRQLGRFGLVSQGDVLTLTDAEALAVVGNALYAPLPSVLARAVVEVTGTGTLSAGNQGKLTRTKQTAAATLTIPNSPTLGDSHQIQDASAAGASVYNVTVSPGSTNVISGLEKKVSSIAVSAAGTGFTSIPTVTISGDGSSGTATAKLKAVACAIVGAGSGYTANDVLTVSGGTAGTTAQITVSTVDGSGHITACTVSRAGSYTVLPSNPVSVTGGSGTGATFTLTWGVESITVTAGGTGYTTATAAISGGAGSGATLAVTLAPKEAVINADGDSYNVYWNGAKWMPFS